MNDKQILIRGANILTMDPALPDLPQGDILIVDGRIKSLAGRIDVDDAEVIDARGMIAVPGFVDAHRHTWQSLLHGIRTDWHFLDYMTYVRGMLSVCHDPEDAYVANKLGALEALDSGITTLVDHSHLQISEEHSDALVAGLKESGIRGIFCYGNYRNPRRQDLEQKNVEAALREITGPLSDWHRTNAERVRRQHFSDPDGLLKFGIATSEFTKFASVQPVLEEIEFSRSLDPQIISMHVGTTAKEPFRLVAELAKAKALGPDMVFVHGNHLTEEELSAIAQAKASIVSTIEPETTSAAWPVVDRFQRMGGTPSIGIDIMLDFSGDMFGQMRLLLNVLKLEQSFRDLSAMIRKVHPKRALEVATCLGAEAIGMQKLIGSLTPGKCADIVLMKKDGLGLTPMNNAYPAVVCYGHPSLVDTVLVNGRVVKRGGALVGVHWPDLKEEVLRAHRRVAERVKTMPEDVIRQAWASRMFLKIEPSPPRTLLHLYEEA